MTDLTEEEIPEQLICGGCGYPVHTLTGFMGPCCYNLPSPWHRGPEGLFNQPTPPNTNPEDEDEDEDESPECSCGNRSWIVTVQQTVEEGNAETIQFAWSGFEEESAEISCANCGAARPQYIGYEGY